MPKPALTLRRSPSAATWPLDLPAALLGWYDRHARLLPWRALQGEHVDPYRVWLSEIMLQQTTVATVKGYFARFLDRWPTVEALAGAPLDDVLHCWAGLGYYARARNLHRCAQAIVRDHGGRFPGTEAALLALPGIGTYTAAAIAAIAFDRQAAAVDGNVERVMARLHAVAEPLPASKPRLRALALALTPPARSGDYAQALMDLGATICTPRAPKCLLCPWVAVCQAHALGLTAQIPAKLPKPAKPARFGTAFWVTDARDRVLLRRRPEQGLLGGMMEVPSSPWGPAPARGMADAPLAATWTALPGSVRHVFTHFSLELAVAKAALAGKAADKAGDFWVPLGELDRQALPTLMRKVAAYAIDR